MKTTTFEEKENLYRELLKENSSIIKSFLLKNKEFNTFKISTRGYASNFLEIPTTQYSLYLELPCEWNNDIIYLVNDIINNKVEYYETLRVKELDKIEYKLENLEEFIEELKEREERINKEFAEYRVPKQTNFSKSFVKKMLLDLKSLLTFNNKKLLNWIKKDFLNNWDQYSFYLEYISLNDKKTQKLLESEGTLEDYLYNKIDKNWICFSKIILDLNKFDPEDFKEISFNLKEKESNVIKIKGTCPIEQFNTICYSFNWNSLNYENLFKGLKDIFKEEINLFLWNTNQEKKYLLNLEIWFDL